MNDSQRLDNLETLSYENAKQVEVIHKDVQYLLQGITEIKTNHLVHLAQAVQDSKEEFRGSIKILSEQIQNLRLADKESQPIVKIGWEVIKYILMGVIGAGLVLLFKK